MRITVWGTRGRFATPGADFVRFGGNTTCIEVTDGDRRLIIDLGTGAIPLAASLLNGPHGHGGAPLSILLSHTHIDHIQGLPFFSPFFIPGNRLRILGPSTPQSPLEATLQQYLRPHHSPLHGLENLAADVSVDAIKVAGTFEVEGFAVQARSLHHGDTSALGFRIARNGRTVAIMTDIDRTTGDAEALARNVDLLIHGADTLHGPQSSVVRAIRLAESQGASHLVLTHFGPDAGDADIASAITHAAQTTRIPVAAAEESVPITV